MCFREETADASNVVCPGMVFEGETEKRQGSEQAVLVISQRNTTWNRKAYQKSE